MKRILLTIGFALSGAALTLTFQNCASSHTDKPYVAPSQALDLSQVQAKAMTVLKNRCASCHSPGSGVDTNGLDNIMDIASLEAGSYIDLGFPQESRLYIDVIDQVMPPATEARLTDVEVEDLRRWLLAENIYTDDLASQIGGIGGDGEIITADWDEIQGIFQNRCQNCHDDGAGGRADMSDFATVRGFVTPGVPGASPLFLLLAGQSQTIGGVTVSPMPNDTAGLVDVDYDDFIKVQAWIRDGANQ